MYRHRTNNPFIMKSAEGLLLSSNIVDEKGNEEKVPGSNTGDYNKSNTEEMTINEINGC